MNIEDIGENRARKLVESLNRQDGHAFVSIPLFDAQDIVAILERYAHWMELLRYLPDMSRNSVQPVPWKYNPGSNDRTIVDARGDSIISKLGHFANWSIPIAITICVNAMYKMHREANIDGIDIKSLVPNREDAV